ncbi:PAS domain-containing hybrid sensor histidine kinase/response regulator [Azospirillum sp.]|uniref:PAS domain-containing hybrid sensor histidine kinase/response regulator n=1 Tax=Azospirillum sp. TaxID=34012 RepID=UPI003D7340C0
MHDHSQTVTAERVRLLYRQMPLVLAINVANAALVGFALWEPATAPALTLWMGALALVTALRAALWGWYVRRRPDDAGMAPWGLRFAVASAASAALWGATALLFMDFERPLTVLLVAFVVAGMAAGAVTGQASHLPTFYAYLLASVLPMALRLFIEGTRISVSMGALVLIFTAGLALIGRTFNATLTRRIQLAEEMQRFAGGLERQVRERTDALQALNDRFHGILSSIDDHVFMIGRSGALLYASPSALRDFGTTASADRIATWSDLGLPPDEAAVIEALHREVLDTGAGTTGEVTHHRPDEPRRHEYRLNPLAGPDGAVHAVVAVSRDITGRRQAEQALEEARTAAEQADQAKSRFLAAASHDLRQPMQSMFLFAGALRSRLDDPQGQDMLAMLERGLDTLKGLLDSLLDVSRLDANVIEPRVEALPVRPLLDDIVAAYQPVAASRGLDVRIGEHCDVQVRSDPMLLGRMVRNLVENAIRYTERGGVVVDCVIDGDAVLIEVRDTGIGIAPDQLDRIFEEFHQIGNPSRDKARGLGLGLAIVQRLSGILDHPVAVRSAPGRGSVFSVRLPRDAASPLPAPVPEPQAETPRDGKLVVLVDDDAIVLLGLRATLESCGYQTLIAGSIDQALDRLSADGRTPDLVIADYRLRGGAVGTDAVRAIRERTGRPLPGIILTGETGAECARDAAEHDCNIILKPVTPRQLAACLERLTGESREAKPATPC